MSAAHRVLLGLLFATWLSGCGPEAEETTSPSLPHDAPSLVLITLDTTRADALGCYGSTRSKTPRMDELAKLGARFEQARTPVPITLPSHATILTGMLPPTHGIRNNAVASLDESAETLADRLQEAGYQTGGFVSSWVLDPLFALDQGFDEFRAVPTTSLVSQGQLEERPANETVDDALDWLKTTNKPFFMWIHLMDPHAPYQPPPPFDREFADSPYHGEVAFADRELGRLLDQVRSHLQERPLYVALTADHGEGLGEHREETHALFVYDTTLRVPFILQGPKVEPGTIINESVSTADLAPTLLELLDQESIEADGRSLSPLLRGETMKDRPQYFESYYGYLNHGWSPLVGLVYGDEKWIEAPRSECFQILEDPQELENLAQDSTREAKNQGLSDRTQRLFESLRSDSDYAIARELSQQDKELLKKLGYLEPENQEADKFPFPHQGLVDPKDRIESQKARQTILSGLEVVMRESNPQRKRALLLSLIQDQIDPTLAQDSENAVIHEYAGTANALLGDYAKAKMHLEKCLSKTPERLEARYTLGWVFSRMGRKDLAYAQLRMCLTLRPSFVKAAKQMAEWEEFFEQYESAASYWEHFLEHWEGDAKQIQEAHDALKRLRSKIDEDSSP